MDPDAEAEAIRRRYIAIFGGTLAAARACPVADLRRLVAIADEQAGLYRAMGFELPEDDAPDHRAA